MEKITEKLTMIETYTPARDAVKVLAGLYGVRMRDIAAMAVDQLLDNHIKGRKLVTMPNIGEIVTSKIEKINQQ